MKNTSLQSRNLMFLFRTRAVTLALLLAVAFAGVSQASVLINPSFEAGDLTGWIAFVPTGASISVVNGHTDTGIFAMGITSWTPTDKSNFCLMESGGLGTPAELAQTFSVMQGDVLTFDYFWDSQDFYPYNDIAIGTIVGQDTLFMESVLTDPMDYWGTHWTHVGYKFANSGIYTLKFSIANGSDDFLGSYLGIDNIRIIPEPATMLLLGLGGVFLRRKRK